MTSEIHHPWDTQAKLWLRGQRQALVSLVLPGATVEPYELDKEMLIKRLIADYFFLVVWKGQRIILHIEFQRAKDGDMARRMWQYNSNKDLMTGLPVYSVLIYLVRQNNVVESPYERLVDGYGHTFTFRVLKLWDFDPEEFLRPGREGLLPLLVLTRDGQNLETVEKTVTTIQERNCSDDLLELAYDFAALIFTDEETRKPLKGLFPMLHTLPILEQSWRVQELKEMGREEAREEAREQIAQAHEEIAQIREEAAHALEEVARIQQQAQQAQQQAREELARAQQQAQQQAREELARAQQQAQQAQQQAQQAQQQAREELARAQQQAQQAQQQAQQAQQQAREEAVRAQQQAAIRMIAWRFPRLESQARILITQVNDAARLETLIVGLGIASNKKRVREVLDSLASEISEDEILASTEISGDERKGNWRRFFGKLLFWRSRS